MAVAHLRLSMKSEGFAKSQDADAFIAKEEAERNGPADESIVRAHLLGIVDTLIAAGVIKHENELPVLREKLEAWRKQSVIRAMKARKR